MNRCCGQRCCTSLLYAAHERPVPRSEPAAELGALGGSRTPSLLIRSQMLYPLSYERGCLDSLRHSKHRLGQPCQSQLSMTAVTCAATIELLIPPARA